MKKINIVKTAACAFSLILFASCDDERGYDDYGQDNQPTVAMNGEWLIDVMDEASGTVYVQHALHKTYDNGTDDGKMFITDRVGSTDSFTGWWLEGEVDVNLDAMTFSATGEENAADGSVFTITEGKILKDAATSLDGNVTDSIYFKGEFDYDPGTIIIFAGHRKTGFLEDEP